jgi:hypothetical protein
MREISSMVAQILIPAIFAATMVFYGFAFWHWRNDGKQRNVRRENPSSPAANAGTFGN